jgi:hypothetical protein
MSQKKPDGTKKVKKVRTTTSKTSTSRKGLHRSRQVVPLGMSPKCRKAFFPSGGARQGPSVGPR